MIGLAFFIYMIQSFQSFLDRFPAPLNPDLFNEPTGYEKALQEVKQYEDFTTIGTSRKSN